MFFNQEINQLASILSGGELARLALAMITIAKIDLLILDEPTNKLDLPTIDQFLNAINTYQGALWVISHDLDFLSRIHITYSFRLNNQTLEPTTYFPKETSLYYQEQIRSPIFSS